MNRIRQTFTMTGDLRNISSQTDPRSTYLESIRDISQLLEGLDQSQWDLPTPCPGWTVADIVAHLIDLDAMALGAPKPDHEPDWASLPHVKGSFSQFTERGVDYRRGTPPQELLKQLNDTANALMEFLTNNSPIIKVPWVKDEMPIELFLSMRTFDAWTHEQDIRMTVNTPGNLGTNPARTTFQRIINSIPLIWGKKVGAPIGSALTLTVTGPEIEGSVHIEVGPDGRAGFVDAPGAGAATITMSWPDLLYAFSGRVPVADSLAAADTSGDLAEEFISQLPSTP